MTGETPDPSYEQACAVAAQAMELTTAHRVPPTPENFEVWYAYCRRDNQDLITAIDARRAAGLPFDAGTNRDLHATYVATRGGATEQAQDLSRHIQDLVQNARVLMASAAADQRQQMSELRNISAEVTAQEPVGLISRLVEELGKAASRAAALEADFARNSDEIERMRESLETAERQSNTDSLTGLATRRALDRFLRDNCAAAAAGSAPISAMLIDIDHFKSFNDTFGHLVGDEVLRFISRTLRQDVRPTDLAARYGGEELMAVLPGASLAACIEVAERFRGRLATTALRRRSTGERLPKVTVSVGVAQYDGGETIEQFIERCDRALYQAKRGGRNRTLAAQPPGPAAASA
jgi:diguanylate cyclase